MRTDRALAFVDAFLANPFVQRWGRPLAVGLGALGFLPLVLFVWYFWWGHLGLPSDAQTYLAAGERLNVGHSLYGPLGAGDRSVVNVALYAAPLLSPPLVAVLWRPLAAVGEWTAYVWWAAAVASFLGCLLVLWVRSPLATGVLVALCSRVFAIELGIANLDSFIAPGLVAIWWLWRGGRVTYAMWIAVLLASLKLVPVFAVVWLLAVAPRRTWRALLAAIAVIGAVSIAGAGLAAHVDYVRVFTTTASSRPGSAPIALAFIVGIVLARRHHAVAFWLATLAMVVAWNEFPLMALLAPLAWPSSRGGQRPGAEAPPGRPTARTSRGPVACRERRLRRRRFP